MSLAIDDQDGHNAVMPWLYGILSPYHAMFINDMVPYLNIPEIKVIPIAVPEENEMVVLKYDYQ